MRMFGKSKGGGRRSAQREWLPLPAVVSTVQDNEVATLIDLSSSGARIRGARLPQQGEALHLSIDGHRAFGVVAWAEQGECGVEFDTPMPWFEVDRLKREFKTATMTCRSVEERIAIEDWASGLAR